MQRLLVACFATLSMAGCATSTSSYTPPVNARVVNTRIVEKPFDVVWDGLVRELSSDFFVINNIDKNSRLINISFSSGQPVDYVDCGQTARTFSNLRGKSDGSYDTAGPAQYTQTNSAGVAFRVTRTTKLNGRANIYVAPQGNGTNVTVNTKYILDISKTVTNLNGQTFGPVVSTIDFSTKSPSTTADGVSCYSRGTVEQKILSFAG